MSYSEICDKFQPVTSHLRQGEKWISSVCNLFKSYKKSLELGNAQFQKALETFKLELPKEQNVDTLSTAMNSLIDYCKEIIHHKNIYAKNIGIEIVEPLELFLSQYVISCNELSNNGQTLKISGFGESKKIRDEEFSIAGTLSYLSPILREAYRNLQKGKKKLRINHDPYKSDVFSLGLVLIYMTSFKRIDNILDLNILSKEIEKAIFKISERYHRIKILLREMLQMEESNRPRFTELNRMLNDLNEKIYCEGCKERKSSYQHEIYNNRVYCSDCSNTRLNCKGCLKKKSLKKFTKCINDNLCDFCLSRIVLYYDEL